MKISTYDNGLFMYFNSNDYVGFSEAGGEAYVELEVEPRHSCDSLCRDADLSLKDLEIIRDWFINFTELMKDKVVKNDH